MSCLLCENNYGTSICGCSYCMCESCATKHIKIKNKNECPQCKKPLNIKYFNSGSICDIDPDLMLRIIILPKIKDNERSDLVDTITNFGSIGNDESIIDYKDYTNLKKKIKPIPYPHNAFSVITGPGILISADARRCDHGCCEDFYGNISKIPDIVNKRNEEMIDNCEVFCLKINDAKDCFCSFTEWGYAKAKNKILVLDGFEMVNCPHIFKEFYMLAIESLKSFENLEYYRKEAIIKFCPYFNEFDYTYIKYENIMNEIIDKK